MTELAGIMSERLQELNANSQAQEERFKSSAIVRALRESVNGPRQIDDTKDNGSTASDSSIVNKSIRRPLKRGRSAKDVLFKIKALQSKTQFCKEQNAINMNLTDRNIRYVTILFHYLHHVYIVLFFL